MSDMHVSVVLVGEESLCLQCGQILLDRGHPIRALVTRTAALASWAEERSIPVLRPGTGLAERLGSVAPFEYLMSIANLALLPDDVLAQPSKATINFHDGPLPRYAGLYCTSWALMNREPRHGVTFHLVEGGVDEGRILAQRHFDVAPDETALTLNAKCYSAGIEAFGELVEGLERDSLQPRAQDLSQRTYFERLKRPAAMATIDWSAKADDIVALVRALDFGGYANPLAMAKVWLGEAVALTSSASKVDGSGEPGTVLAVGEDLVRVACGDGAVELGALRDADGGQATPEALGFREGATLPALGERADRLTDAHAAVVRHEGLWTRRLRVAPLRLSASPAVGRTVEREVLSGRDASAEQLTAALCAGLARVTGTETFRVGYVDAALRTFTEGLEGWLAPTVPLAVDLAGDLSVAEAKVDLEKRVARTREGRTHLRDLLPRSPELTGAAAPSVAIVVADRFDGLTGVGEVATFFVGPGGVRALVDEGAPADLAERVGRAALAFLDGGEGSVHDLPLLTEDERALLLSDLRATAKELDPDASIPGLFEAQVDRAPERTAVVFEGQELSYAALDRRANQLAHRLLERGVRRGELVGLHVERSLEMVVAMIGIQKAGAAYVPMDPAYPRERILHMLEDSEAKVVVTDGGAPPLLDGVETLAVDAIGGAPERRVDVAVGGGDLAYVIYTSGSTGRPKGVMVEHGNVVNFFLGMDDRVAKDPPGTWLAVTSPSFDISVLELAWTLARGFTVLVHRDRRAEAVSEVAPEVAAQPMDFGLCYWGNDDAPGRGKYRLLLEGAKWADRNGLHSVWTPERHFHAFGGPYANPAVSGAAVAAVTRNVAVRSCSCVLPLHHPVRVAEEWAMVDNLTDGRVGLGIAAGWQPDDFVLRPENTPPKSKAAMFRDIETLRRLWRGEEVEFPAEDGTLHAVVSQPRPVQPEVPIWLTIALNPKSWIQAAEIGANVLTHLLGQSMDELAEKIQLYRDRRAELGMDPKGGKVTLMLHTFVDPDREVAREVTREPMKRYLASAASLIKQYVWMFPALKRPHGADAPQNIDLGSISDEDMDAVLEFGFNRYFEESGLLGSIDDCVARVESLKGIGVDEVGCLIDYGVESARMLESLPHLGEVVRRTARPKPATGRSFAELIDEREATHLQCTPSMARMLLMEEADREALGRLDHIMLGGEALPPAVARDLLGATSATLSNMYGPTETTIWSSTDRITDPDGITIGTAISNTALYVLDGRRRLVPPGATGELWIGGAGVTRGYHARPELTAERFVPDPFAGGDARMYRTGDLVRRREDGRLEFLGRIDHQVKFRGYRIELGEIEAALEALDDVEAAVVVARKTEVGEPQLVAYVQGSRVRSAAALKAVLATTLPDYMVPGLVVALPRLPLTPNGKVDRKALPDPAEVQAAGPPSAEAESDLERSIAEVWKKVLGVARVGVNDNFFDLGGHSLLAVRLHRELNAVVETKLSMTDVFRFPTIGSLARHLHDDGAAQKELDDIASRASARRQARKRSARRTVARRS
jgi:natural product biosynthesis luciferase-like monooxygenase protein